MISINNGQDLFVGIVALCLGFACLTAAVSGGHFVRWSGLARGIENLGGKLAVIMFYAVLGIFLTGVGISLLR